MPNMRMQLEIYVCYSTVGKAGLKPEPCDGDKIPRSVLTHIWPLWANCLMQAAQRRVTQLFVDTMVRDGLPGGR